MASQKFRSEAMTRHSAVSFLGLRSEFLSILALRQQRSYVARSVVRRECQYGNACPQKKVDKEARTLYLICFKLGGVQFVMRFVVSSECLTYCRLLSGHFGAE